MSNVATSIRSSMGWSAASGIGLPRRFTAMFAPGLFRRIGRVTSPRTEGSESGKLRKWIGRDAGKSNGGLRFANPPYDLGLLRRFVLSETRHIASVHRV